MDEQKVREWWRIPRRLSLLIGWVPVMWVVISLITGNIQMGVGNLFGALLLWEILILALIWIPAFIIKAIRGRKKS
jgi:hypothetical protein